jgi:hypothetical protein
MINRVPGAADLHQVTPSMNRCFVNDAIEGVIINPAGT